MLIRKYISLTYWPGFVPGCLVLACLLLPARVSAQKIEPADGCENVIQEAENLFFNADFDKAQQELQSCLEEGQALETLRAEIYLLMARIYFAEQKHSDVAEALERLFALNPDYTLDSHLPPPFIAFANNIYEIHASEEMLDVRLLPLIPVSEEKRINNKRWLLIGGSGIVALTTVAIMAGGNPPTPNSFPAPPSPPAGQ